MSWHSRVPTTGTVGTSVAVLCLVLAGCGGGLFRQDEFDVFSDRRVAELTRAAARGDIGRVEDLIAEGVDVNARGRGNVTPLLLVLDVAKNKEGYEALLRFGADPNVVNRTGHSVMHGAAEEEDPFWLRLALAHGGDPNLENTGHRYFPGRTPIFYAISGKMLRPPRYRVENIKLLAEAGADLNHRNAKGVTPLGAAFAGYGKLHALLEAGADFEIPFDNHGSTLAKRLAFRRVEDVPGDDKPWFCRVVKFLRERGVELRGVPDPGDCDELERQFGPIPDR